MEQQPKPVQEQENVVQKRTNLDVVGKMFREEIVTVEIPKDRLSLYKAAGLASDFEVEECAQPGEEYPHYGDGMGYYMTKILSISTVAEGCVAVSITRPESNKDGDNRAFLKALETLKPGKVPFFRSYS